ncbi:MAG: phosphoribosylamine--glycine ligase [Phycisphaerae bacterium]|nr:phosphoribosylamine--glycine ligase [Phycisphaerae bacterium]
MKVLVIGGGGREHAIIWKLSQSSAVKRIYCAPGNAGTAKLAENVNIPAEDVTALCKFAKQEKIGLAIVGPEDPLCSGAVDMFEAEGIRAFGPPKAAAALEGDKAFAKLVMRQRAVPTAESRTFTSYDDARSYIATRDAGLVVKAAGLAKGKGAIVCDEPSDALLAVERIMSKREFGAAGDTVVVEERLVGPEASILAFVDGRNIYIMESAQDHKPIGEGDTGPNTGGMGAYSPTPVVTDEVLSLVERQVFVPVVDAMQREGTPYRGVLYVGLMLTHNGPKVLEFNCRFGDPEAQPILFRLKSDLLEAIDAVIDGRLDKITLRWDPRPSVCVVMASGGYPGEYRKGIEIFGLDTAATSDDVIVFHAGTKLVGDKVVTAGGRVLGITARGETLAGACTLAYAAVDRIQFDGAYCRRDIAYRALGGTLA